MYMLMAHLLGTGKDKRRNEMTNNEILINIQVIDEIKNSKLPISVMWQITKNLRTFSDLVKLYNEERVNIIKRYAKKDENGEVIEENGETVFPDENARIKCISEISELMEQDNKEIQIAKVTLDDLKACDSEQFTPLSIEQIYALSFMIEE